MGRSKRNKNKNRNDNVYKLIKQEKHLIKQEERKQRNLEKKNRKKMDNTILIALFDDFRKGGEHHHIIEGSDMRGTFETLPKFSLSDMQVNNYREPIFLTQGYNSIMMEVYAVDSKTLTAIENHIGFAEDQLETSYILKRKILTPWGDALLYINNDYGTEETYASTYSVKSGDWIDYIKSEKKNKIIGLLN